MKRVEAYLTIYLTLCLTVILSLYLMLIEGVRRNGAGMEAACVADVGLQSIMAEYHRELFWQYNLFAIDSSYGTDFCGKANTETHLRRYLDRNLSMEDVLQPAFPYRDFLALGVDGVEMTGASILTDQRGAVFRCLAVEAIQDDIGLSLLGQIQEWMEVIEINGLDTGSTWQEAEPLHRQITEFAGEGAATSNPLNRLEEKRRLGILALTVGPEENLSQYTVHMEDLVMNRMKRGEVNQGNMESQGFQETDIWNHLAERFLFQEYLLHYMGYFEKECGEDMGQGGSEIRTGRGAVQEVWADRGAGTVQEVQAGQKAGTVQEIWADRGAGTVQEMKAGQGVREGPGTQTEHALQYQIEYLIAGRENDTDNLRSVANRLCALREAANLMYLYSDLEKKAEVQALSVATCTLLLVPELAPTLELAIMMGWAYAESIYDVKSLLAGGRIPLIKDQSSWHYSLESALSGQLGDAEKGGRGLSYQDYLRVFMTLTGIDTLTGRAMNMVEADIRMTEGNRSFRLDGCYSRVRFEINMSSRYGYQYHMTREKEYN